MKIKNVEKATIAGEKFEKTRWVGEKLETYKIHRVTRRGVDETSEEKRDNLMLFHGTNRDNAVAILNTGFKPSSEGYFGPGVYLTASPSCATLSSTASVVKSRVICIKEHLNSNLLFAFVNEVLESENLKKVVLERDVTNKTDDRRQNQFEKYIVKGSLSAEKKYNATYGRDSSGRKIRSSRASRLDKTNHYVCHESLVIPRYLIQYCQK